MTAGPIERLERSPLPCVVAGRGEGQAGDRKPLLVFLHGHDEGPPTPLVPGVRRHGPLADAPLARVTERFVVAAPQLPVRGDRWEASAEDVLAIVERLHGEGADAARTYLTGFSFGGNGVWDVALRRPEVWAALWAVDPTRVPEADPGPPVWLSVGAVARPRTEGFVRALGLQALEEGQERPGTSRSADRDRISSPDRVIVDEGEDHVGSARRAYADERVYRWMLERERAGAYRGDRSGGAR